MRTTLLAVVVILALVQGNQITNVRVNPQSLAQHHTSMFSQVTDRAVLRRAETIVLELTTASPLTGKESITVNSSPSMGLSVKLSGSSLSVSIAQDASVGPATWSIGLDSNVFGFPVAVLFNPYNPADVDVYMADSTQRAEYVENTQGVIWVGSTYYNSPRSWNYDQFNVNTFNTLMYLLDNQVSRYDLTKASMVSRGLSFGITYQNANYQHAVLVGNWGGDYADGTSPSFWSSSSAIFSQYVSSGYRPVKYGQCWVFGALLNSLLRCAGIPSRQVTNFQSGHESPDDSGRYTHVMAKYYDKDTGKVVQQDGSVWNFHSWNDAWMTRSDLSGMNGWQAVDATPQEESEGVMQMGPAPVTAVYNMNDNAPYDTPFVISEVSAKIHKYIVDCSSGRCKVVQDMGIDTSDVVGSLTVTKAVGSSSRQDITGVYKKLTTSIARMDVHAARRSMAKATPNQVTGFLFCEYDSMGRPINVTVSLFGHDEIGVVNVDLVAKAQYITYTGEVLREFWSTTGTAVLYPHNTHETTWSALIDDYYNSPIADVNILVSVEAIVKETSKKIFESFPLFAIPPPLNLVAANTEVMVESRETVTVSFTNPLPISLTDCFLKVDSGDDAITVVPIDNINPGASFSMKVQVSPAKAGSVLVNAVLDTKQVSGIVGSLNLAAI